MVSRHWRPVASAALTSIIQGFQQGGLTTEILLEKVKAAVDGFKQPVLPRSARRLVSEAGKRICTYTVSSGTGYVQATPLSTQSWQDGLTPSHRRFLPQRCLVSHETAQGEWSKPLPAERAGDGCTLLARVWIHLCFGDGKLGGGEDGFVRPA